MKVKVVERAQQINVQEQVHCFYFIFQSVLKTSSVVIFY